MGDSCKPIHSCVSLPAYPNCPKAQEPTAENKTMMQAFEWYVPDDHKHWKRLESHLPQMKAIGIDNIWVPPGCKASSPSGNGYDVYDLYDLGEFDQKGAKETKWGSKDELYSMVKKANEVKVGIYWDAGKSVVDYMHALLIFVSLEP